MDLLQLSYFKRVAELQHVTHAAKELHVSQPAISKTIKDLENEFQVPLFDRVGRQIVINRFGQILLDHATNVLDEIEQLHKEMEMEKGNQHTTVTFSVQVASSHLPEIIMNFKKEHPEVQLRIAQHHNLTNQYLMDDVGICSSFHKVNTNHSYSIFKERICLAVPYEHPFAKLDSICLKDVEKESLIGLQNGQLSKLMNQFCLMAGFEPNLVLECDDPSTVRNLINLHLGLSFVPEVTWDSIQTDTIKLIPICEPECYRYINVKWKPDNFMSPMASIFKDFIIDYFRKIAHIHVFS